MNRISFFLQPRLATWIVFAPVLFFLAATLWTTVRHNGSVSLGALVVVVVLFVLFYFFTHSKYAYIADEVLDFGDHLLVKRRGVAQRVDLANIKDARTSYSPLRIELDLVKPNAFGAHISFLPLIWGVPWREGRAAALRFFLAWSFRSGMADHPLVEELLNRAQAARS